MSCAECCWFELTARNPRRLRLCTRLVRAAILLAFLLAFWGSSLNSAAQTQAAAATLSPSEALRAAMDPFNQARAQNDDLTDADTVALGLGMARASRDCIAMSASPEQFADQPEQSMALGRLCLFGQQFELARAALVMYLALPKPPEREAALILLTRAFLGLDEAESAYGQVDSLLRDYPYDAQIHLAADLVISANEGGAPDPGNEMNKEAMDMCETQRNATLPLLMQGKGLGDVAASELYADALRCVAVGRSVGDRGADETLSKLAAIAGEPVWEHTAELALMREALGRAEMQGKPTPVAALHGHQLNGVGGMTARVLPLGHGTVILAAFTLWAPSAAERIRALVALASAHSVYAVTSWRANTGGEDVSSPSAAKALLAWKKTVPAQVPLLIVPDAELQGFHADQFPAGIAIREGRVVSNSVLGDGGAVRMTLVGMWGR